MQCLQVAEDALRDVADVVVRVRPLAVEATGAVRALVRVAAEEVALRLREVRRQALAAERVKVVERRGEARRRDAASDRERHDAAPRVLARVELLGKVRVDEKADEVRVLRVRGLDAVEERCADDTAALPDARALAQVDVPAHLHAGLADQVEPLRVRADLRRVQRLAHVVHELLLVDRRDLGRAVQHLGREHALLLARRQVPRVERRRDRRRRDRALGGLLHGPAARALHARLVEDLVEQVPAVSLEVVLLGEDRRRDLDQERLEVALVPLVKHVRELAVREPARDLEDVVRLRDELHVAVLDAVVHHLDVVARADRPEVHGARAVVHLRRALDEDRLERVERLLRAARHERRPVAGALLAARDAHAHKVDALRLELLRAAHRVGEPLVTAVHDDVARLHVLRERGDREVHGLAGHHEDDDLARR
ncbi:hypothetical protein PybrP1_008669 [[Pythium] brassicae (nom. inval.)]|nr:hypothetical protein PybrP1_008669 [[Pythium] brassicae (nom. inval.)]